jgi:ribonuclease-3
MNIDSLEKKLGISFKNKGYLSGACKHGSAYGNQPLSGVGFREQQAVLRLVGVASIRLALMETLARKFPNDASRYANNAFDFIKASLVMFSRKINLIEYIEYQKDSFEKGSGAAATSIDQLIASTMETIVGALHMDQGFISVQRFLAPFIGDTLQRSDLASLDPKSELNRFSCKKYGKTAVYQCFDKSGTPNKPLFSASVHVNGELVGTGTGSSKKDAEMNAAQATLKKLNVR